MPGRVSRSADFERALANPACARSAHFALHFVPSATDGLAAEAVSQKLSTADEQVFAQPVDESGSSAHFACSAGAFMLGAVVPKRHARRAVTRTLLKRQIRAAAARREASRSAPAGVWIVRLRAPFERARFPGAASDALRLAARGELDSLFERAASALQQPTRTP
jgi:ribonuclease P protein component